MAASETYVVPELLTVAEVAIEQRVSARTVRRWVKEGRLDYVVTTGGQLRIPIDALPRLNRARLDNGHRRHDRRELGGAR